MCEREPATVHPHRSSNNPTARKNTSTQRDHLISWRQHLFLKKKKLEATSQIKILSFAPSCICTRPAEMPPPAMPKFDAIVESSAMTF